MHGPTLPTLRGPVTEQEALDADKDMIHALSYPQSRYDFYVYLETQRRQIEQVVSEHLGIPRAACSLSQVKEWIHGSYNACLPVWINQPQGSRRVMIRFPLPYKVGESHFPGNVEEKLRCEAATYIWLHNKCPSVPIPRLLAFGLPGTQCVSYGWNIVDRPNQITVHAARSSVILERYGYLIIEYVDDGRMLSESWENYRHERIRRANLFRGLSRVQLELRKHPLPYIGSLTVNDSGILELANRPLTLLLHELENHGIPTGIERHQVYSSVEDYYSDLLACHDNRMRYQPNSIRDVLDGQGQLAALVGMRALRNQFTVRQHDDGPCFLSLTDLHQGNIFVDDQWNIVRIIDLEWACARPSQMHNVPYWLTSRGIDCLDGEALQAYRVLFDEFVSACKEVEEYIPVPGERLSQSLESNWTSGRFWFTQALDCPQALYLIFVDHIQSRHGGLSDFNDDFDATLAKYWSKDTSELIAKKVDEHAEYQMNIQRLYIDIRRSDSLSAVATAPDNESI
ncbi:Hypothetical predicted protein [Lecanosticta acicola]|uniref:Aminoglycoside phosphotransferase domain-containing protein n=1 Tax=Lecanosticta acicola TaxID=111012 RepID=A0AAI8Z5K3_9PEZI|nr:Hypothetical predicted protein [Lecanosticta acicola]